MAVPMWCMVSPKQLELRPDGSDSRLLARRMLMGMLEYMVKFYNSNTYVKVGNFGRVCTVTILTLVDES